MRREYQVLLAVVFLTAFVASCATVPEQKPDNESLRVAAESYWQARMNDDYKRTYALEEREGLPPFEEYLDKVRAMKRLNIESLTVGKVRVDGTSGEVEIDMKVMLPGMSAPLKQFFNDRWIYKRDRWRHLLPK
jgi:hypothetical protein